MLDADGSADPAEMPRFVDALVAGADFAKGTRFASAAAAATSPGCGGSATTALTAVFNLCYGRRYSDLCYGYNVFWRYCLPVLGPRRRPRRRRPAGASCGATASRWRPSFTCGSRRPACKVAEVPSYEYPRLHGVSNLNATRDGLRVVRTMLAERRDDRPALVPVRAQSSSAAAPRMHQEPSSTAVPVVLPGRLATEEESVL